MEMYIFVSFWLIVISFILRAFIIGVSEYPRKSESSIGFDLSLMILQLPFMAWGAYLLWV